MRGFREKVGVFGSLLKGPMDCLFCKIAKKEISGEIIYEDDDVLGLLDINPRAPGHSFLIPKKHRETILDLSEAETGTLFTAVAKVAKLLKETLRPDGFTIGINHGQASGQSIDHLHIHVIPRWLNDKGGSVHSVVSNASKKIVKEIKEEILKAKKVEKQ